MTIADVVGRSMCLYAAHGRPLMCGIIARSAGVFENTKTICACSGRTLWQESEAAKM